MSVAKKLGLTSKLAITVFGVLFFSISMCSLLNYVNFEKNYREIVDSRFNALLENLRGRVEYGLNLGLSLDAMKNVESLIIDAQAADSDIAFIRVFDNQGHVLFSTSDEAQYEQAMSSGEAFVRMDVDVKNNFDQVEGKLTLAYKEEVIVAAASRTQLKLIIDASAMLAIFGLLGAIFMRASLRNLIGSLKYMEGSLSNILTNTTVEKSTEEVVKAELEADFDSFHEHYVNIDKDIDELLTLEAASLKSQPVTPRGAVNE